MPGSVADPRRVGQRAEQAAERHLRWRGWRICARNWIGGGGELDIVACRWRTLLVVEVRQRQHHDAAALSVDQAKVERTMHAAQAIIRQHGLHGYKLRFDVFLYDADGKLDRRRDVLRA